MGTAAVPVVIAAESVNIAVEPMDSIARPVGSAVFVASSELKMGTIVEYRLLEVTWCRWLLADSADMLLEVMWCRWSITDSVGMQLEGSTVDEVPIFAIRTVESKTAVVAIRQQARVAAEVLVVVVAVSEQASACWWFACLGSWLAPMDH